MGSSFLITLREGLEASLVISILLTYLAKTNRSDESRSVWLGTIAATIACLVIGIAFMFSSMALTATLNMQLRAHWP